MSLMNADERRLTHLPALFLLLLCAAFLGACGQDTTATPESVTITIAGSTALHPALNELAAAFHQIHPHVHVELRGGGSDLGETWVRTGEADLAASTLTPSLPAANTITSTTTLADTPQPAPLVYVPVALDGLAIITHPRNGLDNLTLLQLRELYSGRILAWTEGHTAGEEVLQITRERGSGSWQLFDERVMGPERVSLTAVVMPTSADVVAYVASHPFAIGYVSRAYIANLLTDIANTAQHAAISDGQTTASASSVSNNATAGHVRVIRLEGEYPLATNLQSQNYHLTHPLYLVNRGEPTGWTREFIDFVLSEAGQTIVGRYHARVR